MSYGGWSNRSVPKKSWLRTSLSSWHGLNFPYLSKNYSVRLRVFVSVRCKSDHWIQIECLSFCNFSFIYLRAKIVDHIVIAFSRKTSRASSWHSDNFFSKNFSSYLVTQWQLFLEEFLELSCDTVTTFSRRISRAISCYSNNFFSKNFSSYLVRQWHIFLEEFLELSRGTVTPFSRRISRAISWYSDSFFSKNFSSFLMIQWQLFLEEFLELSRDIVTSLSRRISRAILCYSASFFLKNFSSYISWHNDNFFSKISRAISWHSDSFFSKNLWSSDIDPRWI